MKRIKTFGLLIALSITLTATAQLNIVQPGDDITEYTTTNALPYDSLQNISTQSMGCLPGQTLFMQGTKNDESGYFESFYTDNFLLSEAPIYHGNKYRFTPAKHVVGRYYDVLKVWVRNRQIGSACCILLRAKDNGEEIYYNPYSQQNAMTCMGYYEKLKQQYVGKTFQALGIATETIDGVRITPAEKTPYTCIDLGLVLHGGGMFLIMKAEDGQKLKGNPIGNKVYEFVSDEEIDRMIRIYGKKYGPSIAYRHVEVGMTTVMVQETMGEPYRKQSITTGNIKQEYWEYGRYGSITFNNDKVVRVWKK